MSARLSCLLLLAVQCVAIPRGRCAEDTQPLNVVFILADDLGQKPFLVYLPFFSVHVPLMTRPELERKYIAKRESLAARDRFGSELPRKVRLSQDHAVYAGMVETLDNGGVATSEGWPTANAAWRAGKGWLYEGGHPRAGDRAAAGANFRGLRQRHADYEPRLAADDPRRGRPAGTGKPRRCKRVERGDGDGDWKLIEWFDDGRTELFNLANDPGETTDLAAREPERAAALRDRLRRWQRDVGAVGTAPNPRFDPAGPDGRAG